jgi:ABC-type sugar transport system ATPase subunit
MLKIDAYLERKPTALSGGPRHRVALGRAIVREPKLFLFDEPLSNLDAKLRTELRRELKQLHQRLGATMIYVTHDQTEAMTMADRIVVLRDGVIEQVGTPLELYNTPANRFVAGFIGSPKMNFLDATVAAQSANGCELRLAGGERIDVPAATAAALAAGTTISIGIRPEHIALAPAGADGLRMEVALTEQLGGNTVIYGAIAGQQSLVVQVTGQSAISRGDVIGVHLPSDACHLFGTDARGASLGGARIG